MSSIFSLTGGLRPGKSAFNLSHSNLFDCNFGQIIPVTCIECVPGDIYKLNGDVVARLASSLISPALAPMDIVVEAFFHPTRLLMGQDANFPTPIGEGTWETFLSGGRDGNIDVDLPTIKYDTKVQKGSISDFLGVQTGATIQPDDLPLAFPYRAYRNIWNNYYRNENFQDEIQVCQWTGNGLSTDNTYIPTGNYDVPLRRGWKADYFTSALPMQQRGIAPAFTLSGQLPVQYTIPSTVPMTLTSTLVGDSSDDWGKNFSSIEGGTAQFPAKQVSSSNGFKLNVPGFSSKFARGFGNEGKNQQIKNSVIAGVEGSGSVSGTTTFNYSAQTSNSPIRYEYYDEDREDYSAAWTNAKATGTASFNGENGFVDLGNAVTFDISEIRTNFQIQKWMERNARAGYRYTEYLQAHFGVSPRDSRLQRPEFIGGFRQPFIVKEVLQTSATSGDSYQGNQAGQAVSFNSSKIGTYRVREFGYIMVMLTVMPKPMYQQGIPRWMSRKTRFDFYTPEFAHLSEQEVKNKEIYYDSNPVNLNNEMFGFQGIFNELRFLPSRVSNHMRSLTADEVGSGEYTYDYWHQARSFSETPVLNSGFLTVGENPGSMDDLMRIFSEQKENPFIIHFGLRCRAVRPLPRLAEPGLVDHF